MTWTPGEGDFCGVRCGGVLVPTPGRVGRHCALCGRSEPGPLVLALLQGEAVGIPLDEFAGLLEVEA